MPAIDLKNTKNSTAWGICGLLVLAILAIYWPVVAYAFTGYDDPDYLWKNPMVMHGLSWSGATWAFTHFYDSNWHPLTWLSHMLDVQLFGMWSGAHHAVNVLFHAANTVLLFLWLKRLTGFLWRSAAVAALFGLHPLHVESVAWVAERKDVLSTFFMLLSLMAYTRYAGLFKGHNSKSKAGIYCLSVVWFALGLMSKPMVVTLPFVLLLLDYWPLQRFPVSGFSFPVWRHLLVEKIPFFALSVASCIVTFLAQQGGKSLIANVTLPVMDRIDNSLIAYGIYLEKMVWPTDLAVCYPLYYPIDTDLAIWMAFGLLLISAGVFGFRRQMPYLVMGWLWYLGTLVPVIGLIQVGSASMADRYTYVPLIGLFISLVWLVSEISASWLHRRLILTLLSAGVLVVCAKLTTTQLGYWRNSETLARHALDVTIDNAPMQQMLGDAMVAQGRAEEASQHFAEAVRIWPDNVTVKYDLAQALVRQGKLTEAVDTCLAALENHPDEPQIHYLLGNIYSMQGRWSQAIAENRLALQLAPNAPFVLNNLAWLLATTPDGSLRDGSEAVRLAEQACQLSHYQVAIYEGTLGAAYAEAGRFDDAVQTAQKAIALATAAKSEEVAKRNRELLDLYQQKKAYHEPDHH